MLYIMYFIEWLLVLYCIHRIAHKSSFLMKFHGDHHRHINKCIRNNETMRWHWNNLFLINDNVRSTIDLWLTEVLPTLIFSALTQQWWIFCFYYVWAAILQEKLEHNSAINLYPFLTFGSWHLLHHRNPNKNFCLLFPIWDILLRTNYYE